MKKLLKWTGIVLGGLIVLAFLAGVVLYPIGLEKLTRIFPNVPVETIDIPTDSAAIARGRHIAIVWECTKCHGEDLSGKLLSDDPLLGTIPAPNLTSGKGGIGQTYTDADWVQAVRHGVKPDNHVIVEMYDYYSTMSDRDLGDLIAYLKQIPPVDAVYPTISYGAITPVAPALGIMTPMAELIDHDALHPTELVLGATKEYGSYLSPLCTHCHSRNFGRKLATWKQDDFIRAVQTGILPSGKQISKGMPLATYSEMTDTELLALWLYITAAQP